MATPFDKLMQEMSPERRLRIARRVPKLKRIFSRRRIDDMFVFSSGYEWNQGCRVAFVSYDGNDAGFPLNWPSRCEWIVPGTLEI